MKRKKLFEADIPTTSNQPNVAEPTIISIGSTKVNVTDALINNVAALFADFAEWHAVNSLAVAKSKLNPYVVKEEDFGVTRLALDKLCPNLGTHIVDINALNTTDAELDANTAKFKELLEAHGLTNIEVEAVMRHQAITAGYREEAAGTESVLSYTEVARINERIKKIAEEGISRDKLKEIVIAALDVATIAYKSGRDYSRLFVDTGTAAEIMEYADEVSLSISEILAGSAVQDKERNTVFVDKINKLVADTVDTIIRERAGSNGWFISLNPVGKFTHFATLFELDNVTAATAPDSFVTQAASSAKVPDKVKKIVVQTTTNTASAELEQRPSDKLDKLVLRLLGIDTGRARVTTFYAALQLARNELVQLSTRGTNIAKNYTKRELTYIVYAYLLYELHGLGKGPVYAPTSGSQIAQVASFIDNIRKNKGQKAIKQLALHDTLYAAALAKAESAKGTAVKAADGTVRKVTKTLLKYSIQSLICTYWTELRRKGTTFTPKQAASPEEAESSALDQNVVKRIANAIDADDRITITSKLQAALYIFAKAYDMFKPDITAALQYVTSEAIDAIMAQMTKKTTLFRDTQTAGYKFPASFKTLVNNILTNKLVKTSYNFGAYGTIYRIIYGHARKSDYIYKVYNADKLVKQFENAVKVNATLQAKPHVFRTAAINNIAKAIISVDSTLQEDIVIKHVIDFYKNLNVDVNPDILDKRVTVDIDSARAADISQLIGVAFDKALYKGIDIDLDALGLALITGFNAAVSKAGATSAGSNSTISGAYYIDMLSTGGATEYDKLMSKYIDITKVLNPKTTFAASGINTVPAMLNKRTELLKTLYTVATVLDRWLFDILKLVNCLRVAELDNPATRLTREYELFIEPHTDSTNYLLWQALNDNANRKDDDPIYQTVLAAIIISAFQTLQNSVPLETKKFPFDIYSFIITYNNIFPARANVDDTIENLSRITIADYFDDVGDLENASSNLEEIMIAAATKILTGKSKLFDRKHQMLPHSFNNFFDPNLLEGGMQSAEETSTASAAAESAPLETVTPAEAKDLGMFGFTGLAPEEKESNNEEKPNT